MTTQNMDRVCTTIVIIAAVVLLLMGFSEMSKMRSSNRMMRSNSTCGMKSNQTNASAKSSKSFIDNKGNQKDTFYMKTSDEWQNEKVDCKHKEFTQDPVLEKSFTWEAGDEVNNQYDKAKVSHDKAKASANRRSVDLHSTVSKINNTSSRQLGISGVGDTMRAFAGRDAATPKFADNSCVDILQTEAHYQARQEMMNKGKM